MRIWFIDEKWPKPNDHRVNICANRKDRMGEAVRAQRCRNAMSCIRNVDWWNEYLYLRCTWDRLSLRNWCVYDVRVFRTRLISVNWAFCMPNFTEEINETLGWQPYNSWHFQQGGKWYADVSRCRCGKAHVLNRCNSIKYHLINNHVVCRTLRWSYHIYN